MLRAGCTIGRGLVALALLFSARASVAQTSVPADLQPRSPFSGSVRSGTRTLTPLSLSIREAVQRGLETNLGVLLTRETIRSEQGRRQQDRSALLPTVTAAAAANLQQVNIRAQEGITFPGFPTMIGPFGNVDARVRLTQSVLDWQSLMRVRAGGAHVSAAQHSYQDAREQVTLAVGAAYLEAAAQEARVTSASAQRDTARALHEQARHRLEAGTTAAIDVLRALVQLQVREERLILVRNDLAKQKLALARLIGLPLDQEFTLADQPTYTPRPPTPLDEALKRAYEARADHASLLATVRAMELERQAASAGRYPRVSLGVDYGAIGVTPADAQATVNGFAAVTLPIFQGGRVSGEVAEAEASLAQSRQQLEDLRGQIEQDVRAALLDLQSAAERVAVATSTADLAAQTLQQAQDRFEAGVTDNVEVVQAQETVADASEQLIVSRQAHQLAALELGRATGRAETGVQDLLQKR